MPIHLLTISTKYQRRTFKLGIDYPIWKFTNQFLDISMVKGNGPFPTFSEFYNSAKDLWQFKLCPQNIRFFNKTISFSICSLDKIFFFLLISSLLIFNAFIGNNSDKVLRKNIFMTLNWAWLCHVTTWRQNVFMFYMYFF